MLHSRGVVHDGLHASAVGHGVSVLGVKELALVNGVHVADVRQLRFVQLGDEAFGDGRFHDIVVGNHHIVIAALGGLQLCKHCLVGVKAGIVHLIARLLR